eukprot:scaffold1124_cov361-Prasinococcus_capsulatus_cf.AAC.22
MGRSANGVSPSCDAKRWVRGRSPCVCGRLGSLAAAAMAAGAPSAIAPSASGPPSHPPGRPRSAPLRQAAARRRVSCAPPQVARRSVAEERVVRLVASNRLAVPLDGVGQPLFPEGIVPRPFALLHDKRQRLLPVQREGSSSVHPSHWAKQCSPHMGLTWGSTSLSRTPDSSKRLRSSGSALPILRTLFRRSTPPGTDCGWRRLSEGSAALTGGVRSQARFWTAEKRDLCEPPFAHAPRPAHGCAAAALMRLLFVGVRPAGRGEASRSSRPAAQHRGRNRAQHSGHVGAPSAGAQHARCRGPPCAGGRRGAAHRHAQPEASASWLPPPQLRKST